MIISFSYKVKAQDFIIIDSITIIGNHKTHHEVIFRELDILPKDTIPLNDLANRLLNNEKRLLSIGLFTLTDLNIKNWDIENSRAILQVNVQENWYIYPYIIFELADRNFNVWRKDFNYSLDRVNYGVGLKHINLSGRKDKLQLKFQRGYTQKYELKYEYPYLINGWGFNSGVLYKNNKEINYRTAANKQAFFRAEDERNLFSQYRFALGLYNRSNAFIFHSFGIEFVHSKTDTLVHNLLNRNFFANGKESFSYFKLAYDFVFDNRLYPLYPMGGFLVNANFKKEGLGINEDINNTSVAIGLEKTFKLHPKVFLTGFIQGKTNLQRNTIPFFLNRALGYDENVMTGFQLYVIDGTDYLLQKNALKFKIFESNIFTREYMPGPFRIMNLKIFLRGNFDVGYVNDKNRDPENNFVNRWIYGYGPALDIIFYNNFTLSCEYGTTHEGLSGFYFQSYVNF